MELEQNFPSSALYAKVVPGACGVPFFLLGFGSRGGVSVVVIVGRGQSNMGIEPPWEWGRVEHVSFFCPR